LSDGRERREATIQRFREKKKERTASFTYFPQDLGEEKGGKKRHPFVAVGCLKKNAKAPNTCRKKAKLARSIPEKKREKTKAD